MTATWSLEDRLPTAEEHRELAEAGLYESIGFMRRDMTGMFQIIQPLTNITH
ncbi:hypothetical protein [Microbacterium ureisolvens]|uniref:Uncharacterized protein n=1 Tax=Microbacterium ureisolvens TaxID=2781186 RepID=A0ABS7I632_9MICO|nr:hypothetical protein [Microbacterium ureisolvens]MBW9111930.1 hypothetical protein [Microbacterium ureisolvens]